jgi:hypothetical protein
VERPGTGDSRASPHRVGCGTLQEEQGWLEVAGTQLEWGSLGPEEEQAGSGEAGGKVGTGRDLIPGTLVGFPHPR